MKKVINTILLAACFLFFLGNFTTNVLAEGINDKMENGTESDISFQNGELLKNYLILEGERVYFDYDRATQDKVSDDVLEMGMLVEAISKDYSEKTFTPDKYFKASWPVHGNYCGPGHNGNNFTLPVVDVLDQGCQNHDSCYKWGAGIGANCECNRQLVNYIKVYRRWMPANVLGVADAIRVYFETVGSIGC
ncbi:TPA: phospholipase [Streptococcus pyogenes]|uniref:Phospholipase n=3 Tax=Streptococcus TaxID=1301 RepID=A0A5S4TM50_STRPY|nr:hypothetical protein [Streptococcus pyogenes]NP_438167.1 phospholipase [Streptococcus phage phiNIH1.1]NP_795603.1 streptococcal phospholipase A2 [Streptococcus phage 315.4]EQL82503.1 phospholipase A2 domain protein [Streptococcus pyogenes GA19681]ESA46786.1 phospholipase A2 domain protein [Streptococcus pyogenes GA19700]KGE55703.1 phospholipase A2 family protein [Streptococcus pyogenes AA216]KGE59684.1 phospholipase A2 family protein [Streptococcus pyogenes MGAS2111]QBX20178.1 phospholipa